MVDGTRRTELRALLEKATPGPWEWRDSNELRQAKGHPANPAGYFGDLIIKVADNMHDESQINAADAAYLEAVSPEVVKGLLDDLQGLEARLAEGTSLLLRGVAVVDSERARVTELESALAAAESTARLQSRDGLRAALVRCQDWIGRTIEHDTKGHPVRPDERRELLDLLAATLTNGPT